MKNLIFLIVLIGISVNVYSQYPPAAGQTASTAIHKDSSIFIDWSNTCTITRGYVNISDTSFEDPAYPGTNRASFGNPSSAIGIADNNTVSLGDSGSAILGFSHPIVNGQGFDFAVFENSFDDFFLELAYVEVSSDGNHFVRFPCVSLTQSIMQIQGFGTLDPTKIHNLAGKYKVFYGTPFDLNDLQDSAGININHITNVKIIDVIGSITETIMSYDSQGHIINDPFPTPYWTGGFDLDAIGVIHNTLNTGIQSEKFPDNGFSIFPNPASDYIVINNNSHLSYKAQIVNDCGKLMIELILNESMRIDVNNLPKGLYFIRLLNEVGQVSNLKFLKK